MAFLSAKLFHKAPEISKHFRIVSRKRNIAGEPEDSAPMPPPTPDRSLFGPSLSGAPRRPGLAVQALLR